MKIVAMDTETDQGKAVLITKPFSFTEPRNFDECVDFLSQDHQMGCWNMDYDGQAILAWLPRRIRNRLALLNQVEWQDYKIRYVKKKFFKLWYDGKLLFTLYDIQQFYNCSLAAACDQLGVQRKKEIPRTWYKKIKQILQSPKHLGDRIRLLDYALGDAQSLQAIINKTVASFEAAGLSFDRPHSNAAFSKRFFGNRFKVKRHPIVEQWAREAYHGGRIECLMTGFFLRAYFYDIHSAYPSMMATLVKPDGRWIFLNEVRDDAVYAFVDCEIKVPNNWPIGPIPVRRRSGLIFYPVGRFRKTITLTEFRYLEKHDLVKKIYGAWNHIWPSYTYPFSDLTEMYKERKKNEDLDYCLKIIMNASYGVTAETVEERIRTNVVNYNSEIFDGRVWRKRTKYKKTTSMVYAAEITARTRIKLIEDIPADAVISYATDGIFCRYEIPIPTGSELGKWSTCETVANLCLVGSGVYSYDSIQKKTKNVTKFRGFSKGMDLVGLLRTAGRRHQISTRILRNTSLRQAVLHPKDFNILQEQRRLLNVNFDRKRKWSKRWTAAELTKRHFSSRPFIIYPSVRIKW